MQTLITGKKISGNNQIMTETEQLFGFRQGGKTRRGKQKDNTILYYNLRNKCYLESIH